MDAETYVNCLQNKGRCEIYVVLVLILFLFVCLFALRPMSTAMVIAGRSVHLTTLFPGQA